LFRRPTFRHDFVAERIRSVRRKGHNVSGGIRVVSNEKAVRHADGNQAMESGRKERISMRKMIGAFAFVLVALAAAAPLEAQAQRGARGFGMSLDDQVTALTERLALDEEQVVKVREVLEAQAESRRERFQGARGSTDRNAMMRMMREFQEETETLLAEVLSEEQMEKYRKYVAELQQRRRPPLSL